MTTKSDLFNMDAIKGVGYRVMSEMEKIQTARKSATEAHEKALASSAKEREAIKIGISAAMTEIRKLQDANNEFLRNAKNKANDAYNATMRELNGGKDPIAISEHLKNGGKKGLNLFGRVMGVTRNAFNDIKTNVEIGMKSTEKKTEATAQV